MPQDGVLLLGYPPDSGVASSQLVSPELVFSDGATIELTYWLWYSNPNSNVNFLLYRSAHGLQKSRFRAVVDDAS